MDVRVILGCDDAFWVAFGSCATAAAVVVALAVPYIQRRAERNEQRQIAQVALKALQEELEAAACQATQAAQLARSHAPGVIQSDRGSPTDWIRNIPAADQRKLKDLAHIEFPALQAFGDKIYGAKPNVVRSVMTGYGDLMRARLGLQQIVTHWSDGQFPYADDLLNYAKQADIISGVGRNVADDIKRANR